MTGTEYQELAMRTNDGQCNVRLTVRVMEEANTGDIINACLGLSGEVGELNDMIKKCIFHESTLNLAHLKKECGDILWYVALMCEACGWDLSEVMQTNIDKLRMRYPTGFDVERANHRQEGDV